MEKRYIINVYVQGELYTSHERKDKFDFDWIDNITCKIRDEHRGYRTEVERLGGTDGYFVLFNNKDKAICVSFECVEYTEFTDCAGTHVKIGDYLLPKDCEITSPQARRWLRIIYGYNGNYYLRSANHFGDIWHPIADIRNINQTTMDGFIIVDKNDFQLDFHSTLAQLLYIV